MVCLCSDEEWGSSGFLPSPGRSYPAQGSPASYQGPNPRKIFGIHRRKLSWYFFKFSKLHDQEDTELVFPWMNLHHRVLEADGERINQGQVSSTLYLSHLNSTQLLFNQKYRPAHPSQLLYVHKLIPANFYMYTS